MDGEKQVITFRIYSRDEEVFSESLYIGIYTLLILHEIHSRKERFNIKPPSYYI